MKTLSFEVVIIGGGHAGAEAAWIASEIVHGSVCLITLPNVPIASAPCNPAIGGIGKGQVVHEIDALGGLMGKLADLAGIQYRTLNDSKGYAVQSTRVQIDKVFYAQKASDILEQLENLKILYEKTTSIARCENGFKVYLESNTILEAKSVVVTTGTFLSGLLHSGSKITEGGRFSCDKSSSLQEIVSFVKFREMRFKTGTPPRLDKSTINWDKLDVQESDSNTLNFHLFNEECKRNLPQIGCRLTRITSSSLEVIRDNREKSPIFNGQIKAVGPRYCPSIEDKAFRYPDRDSHHVFLEPEGLDSNSIYPNGISTSLPLEVQQEFVNLIEGLESAKILVPGYAVEYDVVDTSTLNHFLEHKEVAGLFFAGQINGTSGYEEAAGQGIVAGLNAARRSQNKNLISFNRDDSYIGVMIDDLVSSSRDEPYRLFTARSENRLELREDNAFLRMAKYRFELGLKNFHDQKLLDLIEEFNFCCELVEKIIYKNSSQNCEYFTSRKYGPILDQISLHELSKRADLDPVTTIEHELGILGLDLNYRAIRSAAIHSKYAGYIARFSNYSAKFEKLKLKRIDWTNLSINKNISFECRHRIISAKPDTFIQLQLIDGIRPATLSYVAGLLN